MAKRIVPATFFLNETHELSAVDSSGGRLPKYAPVEWRQKADRIGKSMQAVRMAITSSRDPLRDRRVFAMAVPEPTLDKLSVDKKKAPTGTFAEETDFSGTHSRVFERLGLDLIQTVPNGEAVVHADLGTFTNLSERMKSLPYLGVREQLKWITLHSFQTVAPTVRVDVAWLRAFSPDQLIDVVVELQPVLTDSDAALVLKGLAEVVNRSNEEKLTGSGTDYSGRHWYRGKLSRGTIKSIAKEFFSVQLVHAPNYCVAAARIDSRSTRAATSPAAVPAQSDVNGLPCVAILDLGIPADHQQLRQFRRGQIYLPDAPRRAIRDHGSLVASRVVFGHHESDSSLAKATGNVAFYDVMVGQPPFLDPSGRRIDEKIIVRALEATVAAAEDVRVFNLSFATETAVGMMTESEYPERRRLVRDLDNFAFANDCVIVVAAGNSPNGLVPEETYPNHVDEPQWSLGSLACGFNTLVCGAFVDDVTVSGLVQDVGWPSPVSRVGPGWCDAPVPNFGEPGGNTDETYNRRTGHGVWCFSAAGQIEDHTGTSFAAPILARKAAQLLHALRDFCEPGTRPFAVTARAFLTLTARLPSDDPRVEKLARRTLGAGEAQNERLQNASGKTAVFLWQGIIESPADITRVQIAIPAEWLDAADEPKLRIVACIDPPVNDAADKLWACRIPSVILRPSPDGQAARGSRRSSGSSGEYPVVDRVFALDQYRSNGKSPAAGDMWTLEFSYSLNAPYPPATDFNPQQRVAIAAELADDGDRPVSPQRFVQALPQATTMTRLSVEPAVVRAPIVLKARL